MKDYIVCEERANHSRIHIKICQNRCENSATCQAFREYIHTHSANETADRSEAVSWPREKLVFPTPA
jgi:hypothetical protein